MVTGHMVADVVAIIGTLDIVLGEIDIGEMELLSIDYILIPYQDRHCLGDPSADRRRRDAG